MANSVASPSSVGVVSTPPQVTVYNGPRPGSLDSYISGGKYSTPPTYPNTSRYAYRHSGERSKYHSYEAWRDAQIAKYDAAYNLYKQDYDSAKNQFNRWLETGLNPNLGYGAVTPGASAGQAYTGTSTPTTLEKVSGISEIGANALGAVFGNIKTLAEAAQIVQTLPEGRFRARMARQLDAAAAAGKVNSENAYFSQVYNSRMASGVPQSDAEREAAENALKTFTASAEKDFLDYATTHGIDGSESDFEGSLYMSGKVTPIKNVQLEYNKHKAEYDNLFSNPAYWQALLDKAVNESWISQGQAWTVQAILGDDKMDTYSKMLALQGGIPGFLAKLSFAMTSGILNIPEQVRHPVKYTVKQAGKAAAAAGRKVSQGVKKGVKSFRQWKGPNNYYDFYEDNYTD